MALNLPDNTLQAVQTYQRSGIGMLYNMNVAVRLANTKFKNFQNIPTQLGASMLFDTPILTKATIADASVETTIQFNSTISQVETLTVDRYAYNPLAYSDLEYVMNAEKNIDRYHENVTQSLSATVEADIWDQTIAPNTYRAYVPGITNNKVTALNSFDMVAKMIAEYKDMGEAGGGLKVVLPSVDIPDIIGSGLTQFVPKRNDEIATSWSLGDFAGASYYATNMLPTHIAGTCGDEGHAITVVSVASPVAGQTQITATTANNATLKENDIVIFNDGVPGQPNLRQVRRVGQGVSSQQVTRRVIADVTADGSGNIVFSVDPGLNADNTDAQQNINTPIVAGMTLTCVPSHRMGVIIGGNSFMLAMPALPDKSPFHTAWDYDPESQISMRVYYGSQIDKNVTGFVSDCQYGATMVKWYCQRICLPL